MATVARPSNKGTVISTYTLECRTDGHNKFYKIFLWRNDGVYYHVSAKYGKIGSPGTEVWHITDTWENHAQSTIRELLRSKKDKGYVEVETREATQVAPKIDTPRTRFSRILGVK